MALRGAPYLVGWSDGTLRLYRLAGGTFVQLASTAAPVQAVNKRFPRPAFHPLDEVVYTSAGGTFSPVNAATIGVSKYGNAEIVRTQEFQLNGGQDAASRFDAIISVADVMLPDPFLAPGSFAAPMLAIARKSDVGGTANLLNPTASAAAGGFRGSNIRVASIFVNTEGNGYEATQLTPDSTLMLFARRSPGGLFWYEFDFSKLPNANPFTTAEGSDTSLGSIPALAVSADSQWVFVIGDAAKKLAMYARSGKSLTKSQVIDLPETPVSISTFGPFVAVGLTYDDGTTKYRTRIFKKSGDRLLVHTTIEGMGHDVLFSKDGSLLIDAFTKKAYARDGYAFNDSSAMMANIATNTTIAAISPHVPENLAQAKFYNGAASDFASNDVDMGALSVLLLNDGAAFNPAHATVSDVTGGGAFEVSGNNWPVGGMPLLNVMRQKNAHGLDVVADNVKRSIFGGSLVARYAVIYSGTRPLIFVDFADNVTIRENESLAMNLTSGFVGIGV